MIEYPEYDSPINLIYQQVQQANDECAKKVDEMTYKAVLNVGVDIDKGKLIEALKQDSKRYREAYWKGYQTAENNLYSASQVAEILADLFGDPCACNYNGIDEWLPYHCVFRETLCPYPPGVSCWEQYLKFRDKEKENGEKDG